RRNKSLPPWRSLSPPNQAFCQGRLVNHERKLLVPMWMASFPDHPKYNQQPKTINLEFCTGSMPE
ncbi:unnamed protein product, partial [Linum tenue]